MTNSLKVREALYYEMFVWHFNQSNPCLEQHFPLQFLIVSDLFKFVFWQWILMFPNWLKLCQKRGIDINIIAEAISISLTYLNISFCEQRRLVGCTPARFHKLQRRTHFSFSWHSNHQSMQRDESVGNRSPLRK